MKNVLILSAALVLSSGGSWLPTNRGATAHALRVKLTSPSFAQAFSPEAVAS
jgi:hypothetical protein